MVAKRVVKERHVLESARVYKKVVERFEAGSDIVPDGID